MPTTAADPGAPVLETTRLRLRPPGYGDAPEMERLLADWDVARFTAAIPHPYPPGAAQAWLDELAAAPPGSPPVWAIERRQDGRFMGVIGFKRPASDLGEIGFWLGKPYWSQGYMSEALAAVLPHAFGPLGLERVQGTAVAQNHASIRVMEKNGFVYRGVEIRPQPARGAPRPVEVRELRRPAR
jgi:RimJ/RimL family protein N-acetyltransferase